MDQRANSDIARKKRIFNYAEKTGNIAKPCRYFGISCETFYEFKRRALEKEDIGLINSKLCLKILPCEYPKALKRRC